jgi:hypothetical protein
VANLKRWALHEIENVRGKELPIDACALFLESRQLLIARLDAMFQFGSYFNKQIEKRIIKCFNLAQPT